MWNVKSTMLFVASLVAVILISVSMANAEEKKITPKEFATTIAEAPGKFGDFVKGEVEKTKKYQKESWAKTKKRWPWNKIFKSETQ